MTEKDVRDEGTDLDTVFMAEADQKPTVTPKFETLRERLQRDNSDLNLDVSEEEANIMQHLAGIDSKSWAEPVGMPLAEPQKTDQDEIIRLLYSINKWSAYNTVLTGCVLVVLITMMFIMASLGS